MAQSISNTVKSPNPLAGLMGINVPNPTAKAPAQTGLSQGGQQVKSAIGSGISGVGNFFSGLIKPPAQTNTPVTQNSFLSGYPYNSAAQMMGGAQSTPAVVPPKAPSAPLAPSGQYVTPRPAVATNPPPPVAHQVVAGANPNAGIQTSAFNSSPQGTPVAPVAPVTQPVAQPQVRGLFPSVLDSLANSSAKNDALAKNAQTIADDASSRIAEVGGQGARFIAGQKTTGTSPVAEGNAAVTAQTTAAEQQAIAQGAGVALTGNAQGITAQGQTQSALNNVANLAAPQVTAYGQTSFNPAEGTFAGGGSLPPEVMQQYAQMAATGQYSAIPSFITSNPVLNAQLNVAAKSLNPNYTPVGAQGASGVLSGIPALQSANAAAEGIKNTINSYIQNNPQLNPSDLAAGNILQQWIQGKQLTDPKYQTLFNYLNEYTNTLAPILGVGGDPTNMKTQIAQSFINAAASGQSISQVLNAMSALATNKIQDLQNGAIGGGTTVPNTSTSGGTGGFAETW